MVRSLVQLLGVLLVVVVVLVPTPPARAADVTCYIDSVAGDDTKSGLSEDEARQDWTSIPSTCTIVKYKRGSIFNLNSGDTVYPAKKSTGTSTGPGYSTSKVNTITNYGDASAPLPKFIKQRQHNNGGMISAYQGNLTIDGIYLEGAESDAQMQNLAQGICIMAGNNTKILNNEITNCDIGMMLSGTGALVQGNYVHDLHVVVDAPPGVDPNLVGGAEGIFVNNSDNEVAYNSFIDCSDYAAWTGGDCDGGATEVTVGSGTGTTVSGLKIHHNLSVNSCGFFEVSSMGALGSGAKVDGGAAPKGTFADSAFYNNVIIDSGWMSLLQVNNTDLKNIRWENNTLVQHAGSVNAGIMAVVYTSVSSGMSGGQLMPDTVYWTNNIFAFDGVNPVTPDKNFVQSNNIITKTDPGFVNFHASATTAKATDFDLVAGSQAIDKGTALAEVALDFLNRPVPDPSSGKPDIGAFEFSSAAATTAPPTFPGTVNPSHGNEIGAGGSSGTGGTTTAAGKGGATGTTTAAGKGGATGTTTPAGKGGATGSSVAGTGGAATSGNGGAAQGAGGAGSGGAQGAGGDEGTASAGAEASKGGCSCRVDGGQADERGSSLWLGVLGLGLLLALRRKARRR